MAKHKSRLQKLYEHLDKKVPAKKYDQNIMPLSADGCGCAAAHALILFPSEIYWDENREVFFGITDKENNYIFGYSRHIFHHPKGKRAALCRIKSVLDDYKKRGVELP
jgi:hypothetical protein